MKSWVTTSVGTSLSPSVVFSVAPGAGPRARVQRGQRLVEQQHHGVARERARECHPLALAPGVGAGAHVGQVPDPEALEQLHRVRAPRLALLAAQRVGDVLPAAQVREQGVVLEQVADAAPVGRADTPVAVSSHTSSPHRTTPSCGRSRPATARSTLVLPAPDGPARARQRPASTRDGDVELGLAELGLGGDLEPVAAHVGCSLPSSLTPPRMATLSATSTAASASAPGKFVPNWA